MIKKDPFKSKPNQKKLAVINQNQTTSFVLLLIRNLFRTKNHFPY